MQVKAIITEKCSWAADLAERPAKAERLFVNRLGGGLLDARTKVLCAIWHWGVEWTGLSEKPADGSWLWD